MIQVLPRNLGKDNCFEKYSIFREFLELVSDDPINELGCIKIRLKKLLCISQSK